ncbi:unnamed protein product [Psylliodes chrysocephalus]|uniref:acid phosphatase n=1 Tax=Psylliodes chrysocephalus TaxID=3402493 RepID=A0A9P0GJP7_9CUCU|nr:unnamed protein product [Psylliodes chrysocephala]
MFPVHDQISRHGDRSPFRSFPNDKFFNESYWPNGLGGQMTEYGIKRLYKLGQWLRERYNHFLSDIYSRKEIYAYAPDFDRCLMSITASLAGMYPPKGHQIWNDHLSWQPVPVHTTTVDTDQIFTNNRYCPKYHQLYLQAKETETSFLKNKYSSFFEFILKKTGWTNADISDISMVRSVFYCYLNYNTSYLPDWYKEVDLELLEHLAGIKYAIPTTTLELTRLQVGPFYDFIFNHFNKFVKPTFEIRPAKFLMMSAQDTSMVPILDSIGCYKNTPVGFGDTVIWELSQQNDRYYLNLFYKWEDKLEQMDCCLNCDYEQFQKNLTYITVDVHQWKKECNSV